MLQPFHSTTAAAMNIRIYATVGPAAGDAGAASENGEHAASRPGSILRPSTTEGRVGGGLPRGWEPSVSSSKPRFSVSMAIPQSEFKLQWPQSPSVSVAMSPRPTARARPKTAAEHRLSSLSQPPNRTPRAWQKLQQRDELEARADDGTPISNYRPGWLSARRPGPASASSTPRILSARARRPTQCNEGDGMRSANSRLSNVAEGPLNHLDRTESVAEVQQQQERQAQQEMRQCRDKLFENPKRRFTRKEMENFCQQLFGSTDIQHMQKICRKSPEDRSYEDCDFLCRMMSKCSFLRQNLSRPNMLAVSRCIQALSLAPGEDMHVQENAPQLFTLVQGLMSEPKSGDLIKQGDHILRFPSKGKASADSGSRWTPVRKGLRRRSLRKEGSSFSERLSAPQHGKKSADSSATSPSTSEPSTPRIAPKSPGPDFVSIPQLPIASALPAVDSYGNGQSHIHAALPEEDERTSGSDADLSNFSRCSSGASSISTSSLDRVLFQPGALATLPPSCYKALDQCHLLVFNAKHLNSLADSMEVCVCTPPVLVCFLRCVVEK